MKTLMKIKKLNKKFRKRLIYSQEYSNKIKILLELHKGSTNNKTNKPFLLIKMKIKKKDFYKKLKNMIILILELFYFLNNMKNHILVLILEIFIVMKKTLVTS